jgi:hypothetical protein
MKLKRLNEHSATEEVTKWWGVISSDNKVNLKKKYKISGEIDETQIYKIWKAEIVEPNQVNLDQVDRMTQESTTYLFDKENYVELTKFLKSYNLCQAQKNNTTHVLANEILRILKLPNNL